MQKKILYGSLMAIPILLSSFWFFAPSQKSPEKSTVNPNTGSLHPPPVSPDTGKTSLKNPPPSDAVPETNGRQEQTAAQPTISPAAEPAPALRIRVTLTAGPSTYETTAEPVATIYDVMASLEKTSSLTFQARHYAGLGYLIETINGIRSANGNYWKLYVNGKYSEIGVSQYRLTDGDVIEWKYEKE